MHGRNLIRHALAAILMLGTLAGTVWTFSNGQLTLAGGWERITSVGGIAAALEIGAIFTGLQIGELSRRIKTARTKALADSYASQRHELYWWFYLVVVISCTANAIFRVQQLGVFWLGLFVAAAPAPLIVLFTIKLQPLLTDYAEKGREATQRALVRVVVSAAKTMDRNLGRMARRPLSEHEQQQLVFAAALVRVYAPATEQQALDYAIAQGSSERIVEGASEVYWTTADLQRLYGIKPRTAQLWMQQTPGRRRAPRGNAWEAPRSAIEAQYGLPDATPTPLLMGRDTTVRTRRRAPERTGSADSDPADATPAQASATQPQPESSGPLVSAV